MAASSSTSRASRKRTARWRWRFAAGGPASLPLVAPHVHGLFAAAARHRGDLAGNRSVRAAFEAVGNLRSACNIRVSVAFAYIELGQWTISEYELTAALTEAECRGLAPVATSAARTLRSSALVTAASPDAADLLVRVILEAREQEKSRFEGNTSP